MPCVTEKTVTAKGRNPQLAPRRLSKATRRTSSVLTRFTHASAGSYKYKQRFAQHARRCTVRASILTQCVHCTAQLRAPGAPVQPLHLLWRAVVL